MLGFLVILSGSSLYNELIRSCLPKSAVSDDLSAEVWSRTVPALQSLPFLDSRSKALDVQKSKGRHFSAKQMPLLSSNAKGILCRAQARDLQEPLLASEASSSLPPLPPRSRTPASSAQPRSIRSSPYTLARSLRAGPTALSPHSLTGPEHSSLEYLRRDRSQEDDEEEGTPRVE